MSDISYQIGKLATDRRTVPVIFTSGDIVHKRDVNAAVNSQGVYDKAATKARVAEIAQGIKVKIAVGAISNESPAVRASSKPQPKR
ncbi:hypothetical protein [uncultured Sphingomonas sp.]|uniref:hypothetical protein n=1 Tax=uncultured Sphingomonas sp. TaxID=158754 RepID=UPI0025F46329|nr:hypothetical protein [uncultured Sphingomonas sp.]